jgi:Fungal specific transcription factor domain/Fungal Zn(2)-Cys(6) binuclear cluster domain
MFARDVPDLNEDLSTPPWMNSSTMQGSEDNNHSHDLEAEWMSPELYTRTPLSSDSGSGSSSLKNRTLAPNLTRRSHKKSRAGCFSCKGRKIKCGEEKPICKNCQLKELECQYPQQNGQSFLRGVLARRPQGPQEPLTSLHVANNFTLADMRLFHHFLTVAYPHLPVGNESVWVEEVPKFAFSESYEYLMHAILALGASHLNRMGPQKEYQTQAIVHRGHAIAGLNQALSKKHIAHGEADAMLAACYALTFQASYMDDGLTDFITMVRGCVLVTDRIQEEQAQTVFNLQPDLHFTALEPALRKLERLDQEFIVAGVDALNCVIPLLTSLMDFDFHRALLGVLQALKTSSREGYINFMSVYSVWYQLCADNFRTFMDSNNTIAQLLLAYFIAIQLMMVPVLQPLYHWPERKSSMPIQTLLGIVQWSEKIFRNIPDAFQSHLHWPKWVVATVQEEISNPEVERRILLLPEKLERS